MVSPKESKLLRREGLKGLLSYIRAVGADSAAAHEVYSRLVLLPPGCTRGIGDSSEGQFCIGINTEVGGCYIA